MTILFAGTEADAFTTTTTFLNSTTAAHFDSTFVRGAIYSTTGEMGGIAWTPAAETWLHFELFIANTNSNQTSFELVDAAGQGILRYTQISSVPTFQYWNGTDWVTVGTLAATFNSRHTLDIQLLKDVDGRLAIYQDNYLIVEYLGDTSALGDVVNFKILNRSSNPMITSQIIVADEPTLGFKLAYRQPTGAGNFTDWDGDFTAVAAALPVDSSFISSTTDGQRESFTKALFTVPLGYRVKAVGAQARARRGSEGPSQVSLMLRFGSTNYDSANKPLELGFTPVQAMWHVNPATSLEWTPSDAGSVTVEFGVRAVS